MWGITGRSMRLGDGRARSMRTLHVGLARIVVRGPLEHAVLEVAGELDFSDVDQFVEQVATIPHRVVSLDLAGLEFLDGAGARAVEQVRRALEERHGELPAIIGATRAVDRTLTLVRKRAAKAVAH
ncbi:MAG: hypothetical protein JWN72_2757 [Thermoleophilia bacterium]|nr:hypothetical protein [Thermoleophilia bacterium]